MGIVDFLCLVLLLSLDFGLFLSPVPCDERLFLFSFSFRFFVDIRLYNKARSAIEPFAFEKYRKEKIRQQVEATRPARLKIKTNLPAVNQELALKYMDNDDVGQKRTTKANLLKDDRFKALFTNPEFEVDKNADEYKMLTPVLSRLEKGKVKELKRKALANTANMPFMEDDSGAAANGDNANIADDDDLFDIEKDADDGNGQSSSDEDDDRAWQKDLKNTYHQLRKEQKAKRLAGDQDSEDEQDAANGATVDEKRQKSAASMPTNLEFKVKNITTKANK